MDSNTAGTSGNRSKNLGDDSNSDDDEVMMISDALKYQDEMMENAAAVLGAADSKHCSYKDGYLKRQPLYACLTCIPEAQADYTKSAGVCLACTYNCHDGHNLIELYTKRNFCCDCGNMKFDNFKCNLNDDKREFNEHNSYNQNFSGLYCSCARPFPDPEDPIVDGMLQCVLCEDWFHSRHLEVSIPANYAEMICGGCVKAHEFLLHYDGLAISVVGKAETNENVNVENTEKMIGADEKIAAVDVAATSSDKTGTEDALKKEKDLDSTISLNGTTDNIQCTKPTVKSENISARFMEEESWRQKLCKCKDCRHVYEAEKVEFLIDPLDPVQVYEETGKAKVKEIHEEVDQKRDEMLRSMDRVHAIEFAAGICDFKHQLGEYLKKFAENKKVIRLEDVREFFTMMKSRKRQKSEMSYYCK